MTQTTAWGVLSDIHGNLVALETALDFLSGRGVENMICCGDVVGYGPWPNECVALIKATSQCCVLGNHDAVPAGVMDASYFGGNAATAIRWTQAQLTQDSLAFLQARPQTTTINSFCVTHGSPRNPLWEYLTDRYTAYNNFHHFEQSLCWFGHSHVPTVFACSDGEVDGGMIVGEQTVELDPDERYLINPGSVGQPRDGDPRLSLAVYEHEGDHTHVSFHRLEYDIHKVQQAMRAAGLPPALYNRLSRGR